MKRNKLFKLSIIISGIFASCSYADTINTMSIIDSGGLATLNISNKYGVIESLPFAPLSSGVGSTAIASTPYKTLQDQQYTFIANPSGDSISVFKPQLDGSLQDLNIVVPTGRDPSSLTVDAAAKHLYVTNRGDDTVFVYSIDPDTGNLSRIDSGTIITGKGPSSVALNATRAIVTNRDSDSISFYEVDPETGLLSFLSTTTVGVRPIMAKIVQNNESKSFVHVLNEGSSGRSSISQMSIPETGGTMVKLQPSEVFTAPDAQFMTVREDQKYVFVTNKRDDHRDFIAVYTITSSGALTLLQEMTSDTNLMGESSAISRTLSTDPRGLVIYATNAELGTVSSYEIESATSKLNSVPVTTQRVEDPVAVTSSSTQGEPLGLEISTDDYDVNVNIYCRLKTQWTVKNKDANPWSNLEYRYCLHQYGGPDYEENPDYPGDVSGYTSCYDLNSSATNPGYATDSTIYDFWSSNNCSDSLSANAFCGDGSLTVFIDAGSTNATTPSTIDFYTTVDGDYDGAHYSFSSDIVTATTVGSFEDQYDECE